MDTTSTSTGDTSVIRAFARFNEARELLELDTTLKSLQGDPRPTAVTRSLIARHLKRRRELVRSLGLEATHH